MFESKLLKAIPSIRHGFNLRDDPVHPEGSSVWLGKQIHSDRWYEIAEGDEIPPVMEIEVDAVVTRRRQQAIGVRTADCVPLLVAAPETGFIAAVHAGWKGTELAITQKCVAYLQQEKEVDPGAIYVALGPCIHKCCYPVDLIAANREQLLDSGVPAENIDVIDDCTQCRGDLFHSYRRDGESAGRQVSWIQLVQ